jgi:hypothetical protein
MGNVGMIDGGYDRCIRGRRLIDHRNYPTILPYAIGNRSVPCTGIALIICVGVYTIRKNISLRAWHRNEFAFPVHLTGDGGVGAALRDTIGR